MRWLLIASFLAVSYPALSEEPYWEVIVRHQEGWTSLVTMRSESRHKARESIEKWYCYGQLGLDECIVKGPWLAKTNRDQYARNTR